jgi:hypothetical protein
MGAKPLLCRYSDPKKELHSGFMSGQHRNDAVGELMIRASSSAVSRMFCLSEFNSRNCPILTIYEAGKSLFGLLYSVRIKLAT